MKHFIKRITRFTDDYETKEAIILRDHLAMERTKLANERTLLSYTRTSLYLVLGGIAFLGMKDFTELRVLGYVALSLSVVVAIIGIVRYRQLKRHLRRLYVISRPAESEDQHP